jgi:glycosyltransferase involved in cell wall biosynthesis
MHGRVNPNQQVSMHVVHFYPWGCFYPVSSGADVTATHQMEYLRARGWKVDCLVSWADRDSAIVERFRAHYSWVNQITFLDVPPPSSFSFESLIDSYCRLKSCRALRRALPADAELFLANYFFSAPLLDLLPPSCKRVLETHDIMSDQFLTQERYLSSRESCRPDPLLSARRRYLLRAETNIFRLYDATILVQPDELQAIDDPGNLNLHYVPRMCSMPPVPSAANPATFSYDLLFVGSDHMPNQEGINWFCRNVYHPFLSGHKIRLGIVGRVCDHVDYTSPCVTKLGVLHGSADALKNLYLSAALVIVPIFEGTGISIKTLEALALGRVVVSTPVGARGLRDSSQAMTCVDMAADPRATAETILELLRTPTKREALQAAARAYISRHHSREAYFAAMDRVIDSIGIVRQAA